MEISIVKGRAKSKVLTSSLSPEACLRVRLLMILTFPIGGGAVISND